MDYYKILNVSEDSSLKEIEQSYKDLSSFYNPENNVSKNAYKKYREINEAYRVLSEIKQKEMYDKLHLKEEGTEEIVSGGELLGVEHYLSSSDYFVNDDVEVNINHRDIHVYVDLSYLYYLTNSDYLISYNDYTLEYSDDVCDVCNGEKLVRYNNKVCTCPSCFGRGNKARVVNKEVKEMININDSNIVIDKDDYRVYVHINFYDKEFYRVENDEIFVDYIVNEEEYLNGIKINLLKGDMNVHIDSLNFKNSIYTFLDKIIHFNYILTSYKGRDTECYLLTDKSSIYLNLNDFTYTSSVDDLHTYKLNIDSPTLVLEGLGDKGYKNKNGNLIVHVIKVRNNKDEYLFFNREIKKVSANLFKFRGNYNNHKFNSNGDYSYDDNFIYLPSKAYKLASKSYLLFKILYALLYFVVPLILYLIMGFNITFCVTVIIFFVIYLIGVNLLMEVKI